MESKVNSFALMLNRVGTDKVSNIVSYKPTVYDCDSPSLPDFLDLLPSAIKQQSDAESESKSESEEEFTPETVEIFESGKRRPPRRSCVTYRKHNYDERD